MTSFHYIYQDFGDLVSCERNCWLNLTDIKNLLIFRLISSLTPAWNELNGWYWSTKLFWAKTKTKESRRIFSGYFFLFWRVFRLCYRIFSFGFLPVIPTAGALPERHKVLPLFIWVLRYTSFSCFVFLSLLRKSLGSPYVVGYSPPVNPSASTTHRWVATRSWCGREGGLGGHAAIWTTSLRYCTY